MTFEFQFQHLRSRRMSNVKGQSSLAKISVIVPVKDEADSIRQLLQGLSAQTYQLSEIVITDGPPWMELEK